MIFKVFSINEANKDIYNQGHNKEVEMQTILISNLFGIQITRHIRRQPGT